MFLEFDKLETWPKIDPSSPTKTYFGKCTCHGKRNPILDHFGTHLGTEMGTEKYTETAIQKNVNSKTGQTNIWCRFGSIWGPYFATKNDHDVEAKMSSKKGGSKGDPGVVRGPGVIYI